MDELKLPQRLRKVAEGTHWHVQLLLEAANRIEELEKERTMLYAQGARTAIDAIAKHLKERD